MNAPSYRRLSSSSRSIFIQLALGVQVLLLLSSAAFAATEIVVGTWRKPDQSLVEFKPDGSVMAGETPLGRWERLRDSSKFIVRFKGALGYHEVRTGRYHRQLFVTPPSTGVSVILERVDGGPTVNPDVPTEHQALEMEYDDTVTSIERTSAALSAALAAAAEARQRHVEARLMGRVSGWIPIAQKKEAEAKGLESSLNGQRASLRKLATKLGRPVPQAAAPSPPPTQVVLPPTGRIPPFVRQPTFIK